MPTEILMLALASALLVVQILIASGLRASTHGFRWAAGPRDETPAAQTLRAERADRAARNLQETFPVFAALVLGLVVADRTSGTTALAAQVWFWARVAYVPAYILHAGPLRSLVWLVAFAALGTLFVALVLPGGA
jgi:uncharacterized MAPEG superfamily protein